MNVAIIPVEGCGGSRVINDAADLALDIKCGCWGCSSDTDIACTPVNI